MNLQTKSKNAFGRVSEWETSSACENTSPTHSQQGRCSTTSRLRSRGIYMELWRAEGLMLKHMWNYHKLGGIFQSLIGNPILLDCIWNSKGKNQGKRRRNNKICMETYLFMHSQIFKYYLNTFQLFNLLMVQIYKLHLLSTVKTTPTSPLNSKSCVKSGWVTPKYSTGISSQRITHRGLSRLISSIYRRLWGLLRGTYFQTGVT